MLVLLLSNYFYVSDKSYRSCLNKLLEKNLILIFPFDDLIAKFIVAV